MPSRVGWVCGKSEGAPTRAANSPKTNPKNGGTKKDNGSLCPLQPRSPTRWPAPRTGPLGPGPAALPPICSFKSCPSGWVGAEHAACPQGLGPHSPLCLSHVGHGCHTHTGQSAKGAPGGTLVCFFAAHSAPFSKGHPASQRSPRKARRRASARGVLLSIARVCVIKLYEGAGMYLPVTGHRSPWPCRFPCSLDLPEKPTQAFLGLESH